MGEAITVAVAKVAFDGQTYLLLPSVAKTVLTAPEAAAVSPPTTGERATSATPDEVSTVVRPPAPPGATSRRIRLHGSIPPEVWNRVGNRLLPKLRAGTSLNVSVGFDVEVDATSAEQLLAEIRQILADLSLSDRVSVS